MQLRSPQALSHAHFPNQAKEVSRLAKMAWRSLPRHTSLHTITRPGTRTLTPNTFFLLLSGGWDFEAARGWGFVFGGFETRVASGVILPMQASCHNLFGSLLRLLILPRRIVLLDGLAGAYLCTLTHLYTHRDRQTDGHGPRGSLSGCWVLRSLLTAGAVGYNGANKGGSGGFGTVPAGLGLTMDT